MYFFFFEVSFFDDPDHDSQVNRAPLLLCTMNYGDLISQEMVEDNDVKLVSGGNMQKMRKFAKAETLCVTLKDYMEDVYTPQHGA